MREDKVCPPSLRKSSDDVVAKCISISCIIMDSKRRNLGLKCVRMRLAAELRLDPMGELECSPRPLAEIGGAYF